MYCIMQPIQPIQPVKTVQTIQTKHEQHVKNLDMFIKHLKPTRIQFVFFNASNMDKPLVMTTFGKHKDWYIIPGQSTNYCYAYTKSNLTYMVTHLRIKQKGTIVLYNVKLNRVNKTKTTKTNDVAYLGNHIDFSIHNSRNDVFYSVHLTEYFERNNDLNSFDRKATTDCNFITPVLRSFGKTSCLNGQNVHLFQLDKVIAEKNKQTIIEDLWRASTGNLILQRGGVPRQPEWYKSYKGIDTTSTDFFEFINISIFQGLWKKMRHSPQYVYQYLDQDNELDPFGNKSIQYIVEFEEQNTIAFAISSHRALKACWTGLNLDIASIREKRAFAHWQNECVKLLATDFYL